MSHDDAHSRGEALCARLDRFERPLYLLAHHDDEITTAGLLQRLGPRTRIVWLTNSDGRYFDSDLQPAAYGEFRKAEGVSAVARIGIPAGNTRCLDFSEVEIYRRLSQLHSGAASPAQVRPFFRAMRDAVRAAILELRPDLVVSLAWQGGQPEHDLTHFFTKLALDDLERQTGRRAEFLHFPAYEYTYALAARFHPLYHGERLRIRLSPAELEGKLALIAAYPSQVNLFRYFRWAFRYLFWPLSLLTGGPRTIEQFLGIEEFGPVPAGLDYTARPHALDALTYMFDDFEGVPVSFHGSVRPLVQDFLAGPD